VGEGPAPYETGRSVEDYRALLARAAAPRRLRFETARGEFVAELLGAEAPLAVASFVDLARGGYFDGQRFHRVVPDFVLQGGDPGGDGYGGPGFEIRCEINPVPYGRGTLGMALAGKDTGGSQFFVTHAPQPHLDGRYTVFGQVVSGLEVMDALSQGETLIRVAVE
jgi:cyclophilin family peptidyl-prolyl cis-trans isomerase